MRWLIVIAVVVAVVGSCGAPPPQVATTAPIVSSPGPLIASHATLVCTDCHLDGSPLVAAGACSRCHTDLAAANRGLHAVPKVRGQSCTECHRDHRGPRFDSRWGFFGGRARFDHAYAGWKLGKGHRVQCEKCHPTANAAKPSFQGLTFACGSCHAPPHAGTPYESFPCEACHLTADSFKILSFDHDEKTRPIGASHRKVACASCHTPQLGTADPPRACASCHASRDPHNGRFAVFGNPPACEKCHAPSMWFKPGDPPPFWRANKFDHARDGKWRLDGKHSELLCRACHISSPSTTFAPLTPGTDCLGCHEHRNAHARKYPNGDCLKCHTAPGATMIRRPLPPPTSTPPSPPPTTTPAPTP